VSSDPFCWSRLSSRPRVRNALILVASIAVVVGVALLTIRSSRRALPMFERTIESSSQVAVRAALVLIFALALLAYQLGLDLLLGGFAAWMITRQLLKSSELPESTRSSPLSPSACSCPSSSSSAV
jgi:Kef-type K+ transport system membrane component KefB